MRDHEPPRPSRGPRRARIALLLATAALRAMSQEWSVDFATVVGETRPLHGVNGGPLCYRGTIDLRDAHRRVGIPLTRLHDTVWVNAEAVDVHTLFRDARADPADTANYDFRATDDYVQAVRDTGAGVVYRLGESIEHTPRKYWVNPPSDPERWAAVCEGIVRHYEQGWAGGPTNAVKYWEIWNEPDVRPAMWTGTDEEFLRLFELTARRIKTRFPNVKIGGPGLGGVGDFAGDAFRPSTFARRFLEFCRHHRVPLDFFSWHRYTADSRTIPRLARAVRTLLDDHGFRGTESHLNEWNYLPDDDWRPMLKDGQGASRERWYARMNGVEGAAFVASVLIGLQDAPVDAANFYTGEVQGFGLFDIHGRPKTTYRAFEVFHEQLATPRRVRVTAEAAKPGAPESRWSILAGRDDQGTIGRILVALETPGERKLTFRVAGLGATTGGVTITRCDTTRAGESETWSMPYEPERGTIDVSVRGPGVVRLEFRRKG